MRRVPGLVSIGVLLLGGCGTSPSRLPLARISVRADRSLGAVDPKIYGHFIENLGRCIYGGIWDGGGVRPDVLARVQALRPPVVRWPGGAYSDCSHWTDGIGPEGSRPVVPNCYPAWAFLKFTPLDTHAFGTDEFLAFARSVGAEPYLNVNLGSGTAEEAAAWVAYCNALPTSRVPLGVDATGRDWGRAGDWARARAANGHSDPYGVELWGVGNEIYGGHEVGGPLTPTAYVGRFSEFAAAMRAVDPSIRLVAVGSDEGWNDVVLSGIGETMDYLSIHLYYPGPPRTVDDSDETARSLLAAPAALEATLDQVGGTIDRTLGASTHVRIALDEWNLWWSLAQLDAWPYSLRDGLFAALVLNALERHASRVGMANVAQLVNALGLLDTSPTDVYATPLYEAFLLYRESAGDLLVDSSVQVEGEATPALGDIPARDAVPYLDATATLDRDGRRLALMVVNRHLSEAVEARIDLTGFTPTGPLLVRELNGPSLNARNSFQEKDTVGLAEHRIPLGAGSFDYSFPAHSATALVLSGISHPLPPP